jgi:hypothetical protein
MIYRKNNLVKCIGESIADEFGMAAFISRLFFWAFKVSL